MKLLTFGSSFHNTDTINKLGFGPLSIHEIQKDLKTIEKSILVNGYESDSDSSIKTGDILPSEYPVKPRKTPRIIGNSTNPSHNSNIQRQKNSFVQPERHYVKYDRRSIDESFQMIKTVQIKFPELWKNELIYETIEQQYQAYLNYLSIHKTKLYDSRYQQENYLKIFQGLFFRKLQTHVIYNRRLILLKDMIHDFQYINRSIASVENILNSVSKPRGSRHMLKTCNNDSEVDAVTVKYHYSNQIVRIDLHIGETVRTPYGIGQIMFIQLSSQSLKIKLPFGILCSHFKELVKWAGAVNTKCLTTTYQQSAGDAADISYILDLSSSLSIYNAWSYMPSYFNIPVYLQHDIEELIKSRNCTNSVADSKDVGNINRTKLVAVEEEEEEEEEEGGDISRIPCESSAEQSINSNLNISARDVIFSMLPSTTIPYVVEALPAEMCLSSHHGSLMRDTDHVSQSAIHISPGKKCSDHASSPPSATASSQDRSQQLMTRLMSLKMEYNKLKENETDYCYNAIIAQRELTQISSHISRLRLRSLLRRTSSRWTDSCSVDSQDDYQENNCETSHGHGIKSKCKKNNDMMADRDESNGRSIISKRLRSSSFDSNRTFAVEKEVRNVLHDEKSINSKALSSSKKDGEIKSREVATLDPSDSKNKRSRTVSSSSSFSPSSSSFSPSSSSSSDKNNLNKILSVPLTTFASGVTSGATSPVVSGSTSSENTIKVDPPVITETAIDKSNAPNKSKPKRRRSS